MPGFALIANALLILLLIGGVWLQPWNDEAPADKTWHQPEVLAEQFSERISPTRWSLDIILAEQQLGAFLQGSGARLAQSGQPKPAKPWNELEVGPALAQQLEEAARTLPPQLSEADLNRAGLLLEKSFPGAAGVQLS